MADVEIRRRPAPPEGGARGVTRPEGNPSSHRRGKDQADSDSSNVTVSTATQTLQTVPCPPDP
ncbi:hypothetical protein SAMN05421541_102423 [Actinoplanes philippinensis]|uniref:Uncharacterized protein n=1 Tax=Actinoplanes philippinensis TaxID=35752 RepID=A0A1I2BNX4_9ACTN|nr:hypothetical protein SAMN05421541_102423 [Actinoplanes philippinensis]